MQRAALVIRTCGDMEIATQVAKTFESPELKKLRAEVGIRKPSDSKRYSRMIRNARRKYRVKPMSPFRQRIWGLIGLAILYAHGG